MCTGCLLIKGQIAFIGLFCYSIPLTLIKISILLFYRAIFVGRLFDIGTYVTGAFVIAWGIAVPLVSIFSCHPIGAWHLTTRPAAICINDRDFFIGNSSLNILADVVILCLPMGMVWELQMSRKSKAAVSGMVLMGGWYVTHAISGMKTEANKPSVIVASCLRLRFLLGFKRVDVTCEASCLQQILKVGSADWNQGILSVSRSGAASKSTSQS